MKTNAEYIQMIQSSPVFAGYTEHGAQQLLQVGTIAEYPAGHLFFTEGEAPESVLLVLAGRMCVFVQRGQQEVILTESGPGTILGELAVLSRMPRAASVRTSEPSTVLTWPAQAFRRLLLGNAFLSEKIFAASIRMLVEKERALIESLAQARAKVS